VELAILWALAAAMALLVVFWGVRNERAGYPRPPRRALLEDGFRLLRHFEETEPPLQTAPAPVAKATPIEQLVSLSLAVQSAVPQMIEEKTEDAEVIPSPT
jgi:hypothetical protein